MRLRLFASAAAAAIVGGLAAPASAITYAQYTATYMGTGQERNCSSVPCTTTGPRPTTVVVVFTASTDPLYAYPPQSFWRNDGTQQTSITPRGASADVGSMSYGSDYTANFTIDPSFDGNGPLPYFDTAHLTGGSLNYAFRAPNGTSAFASGSILSITTLFSNTPFRTSLGAELGAYFPTPAPEPATWAMMLVGFGVAGTSMRRRSKVRHAVSFA